MGNNKKQNFYEWAHEHLSKLLIRMFRITIIGAENQPDEGGLIAVSNHISFLDVIVMAVALKRQIRFMAKKELFGIPLLGGLIKSLGAFPVDRKGSVAGSMKKAISLLKEGDIVGMFPTGHRFRDVPVEKTLDEVKGGVGMAAYHAKAPMLPLYISTKNNHVKLFRPITIYVGKPVAYDELGFVGGGTNEYENAAKIAFSKVIELSRDAALGSRTVDQHKLLSDDKANTVYTEDKKNG